MNEERAWYLLSLQLSGEATAEELEEFNMLLQQHPELGLRVEIMRNLWASRRQPLSATANHFDKHLQRLSNHLSTPVLQFEGEETDNTLPATDIKTSGATYHWLWIAAGIAASVLIVLLLLFRNESKKIPSTASNTISTRPGSKSKIELPDGTQVWLNANSKLIYNQNFLDSTREVQLTGEAYFDVVPAVSQKTGQRIPFIIHTSSIDVKVLGTAFNVRSYPGEKTTETALIHGSVEVTLHNNPDKKIILKPKEKLVVLNDDTVAANKPVEHNDLADGAPMMALSRIKPYKGDSTSNFETMWVKNKLAFDNESFDRMMAALERWYSVTFIVKNESLNTLHFTGVFENKSLIEVMEALSISRKFHYEIKDNQVTIW
jgi:ferric-dicitrate binding protein FerR (iron transport regulator)